MNRRRCALAALGSAVLLVPGFVRAQPSGAMRRIGMLFPGKSDLVMPLVDALRGGLRDLGWIEGRNLVSDLRLAEFDFKRIDAMASELLALKPEVMVAGTSLVARTVQRAAPGLPIVVGVSEDPVGDGLVASLARPGGTITGLSTMGAELVPKRLQLLREFLFKGARVAVLTDPATSFNARAIEEVRRSAPRIGVELVIFNASKEAEIAPALARLSRDKIAGLLVMSNLLNTAQRQQIVAGAGAAQIPAIYAADIWADIGGLLAYGINYRVHWRRVAPYIDKILKGAKPADLPVEQPTTFELVVNLKSAKAQGIKVPHAILVRADRVIE